MTQNRLAYSPPGLHMFMIKSTGGAGAAVSNGLEFLYCSLRFAHTDPGWPVTPDMVVEHVCAAVDDHVYQRHRTG